MDKFIAQQRLLYPLSDESVLKLTERMEEVFAPKGSFPVYEGDRDPYVWFVKEGLARSFVGGICATSPYGSCRRAKS